MDTVIRLEHVCFSYDGHPAIEDVTFDLAERDYVGIIGPNGAGKSTLLRLMLGLLKPTSGTVTVMGGSPESMRRFCGYVPQYAMDDRQFPITVFEVAAMGIALLLYRKKKR